MCSCLGRRDRPASSEQSRPVTAALKRGPRYRRIGAARRHAGQSVDDEQNVQFCAWNYGTNGGRGAGIGSGPRGHRTEEPAAQGRSEPGLVRDRRPGLRTACLADQPEQAQRPSRKNHRGHETPSTRPDSRARAACTRRKSTQPIASGEPITIARRPLHAQSPLSCFHGPSRDIK